MTDEQNTPKNIPTEDYSILPQQVTEALISAAAAARKDTDPNGPAPDLTVQQALEILNNAENIDEPIKRLARAAQAKVKIQALEDALNVRRKRATRRKKQPESIDIEKWITDTEATAAALEESNQELARAFKKIDLVVDAQQELRKSMEEAAPTIKGIGDTVAGVARKYAGIEKIITALNESMPDWLKIAIADYVELKPYLMAELEKPEYEGATLEELMHAPALDENGEPSKSAQLLECAIANARNAQKDGEPLPPRYRLNLQQFAEGAETDTQQAEMTVIEAQKAGREQRRRLKENAEKNGAIMNLRNGSLPIFSGKDLWNAFAPGRVSKLGNLAPDMINKETGRLEKINPETGQPEKISIEKGDIIPLNALDISYKAFLLLNAIIANTVENIREYFVSDGSITFYVKGVLDALEVDPRIKDDMQLDFHRKTAGVLYLEKQFEPLLSFIGTTPDGSRYSVFNYVGYNADSDTMTVRTPYLYQLWETTQTAYSARKRRKAQRIAEGKKPLKIDLKPLEVNVLLKASAYKEDDAVLEIASYINNLLLNAGKGAHKTEISYKTLINNCTRLHERLKALEALPNVVDQTTGKKINKAARYNSELRKIARAYNLIMDPEKCDVLKCFEFEEFTPTKVKNGKREFIPPTKSTLGGKIVIKWRRIDHETD